MTITWCCYCGALGVEPRGEPLRWIEPVVIRTLGGVGLADWASDLGWLLAELNRVARSLRSTKVPELPERLVQIDALADCLAYVARGSRRQDGHTGYASLSRVSEGPMDAVGEAPLSGSSASGIATLGEDTP